MAPEETGKPWATHSAVNPIRQLLPRRIPAQTMLILLITLPARPGTRPRRMRRATPASPGHRVLADLPDEHAVARRAGDEGAVGGEGQRDDGRLHRQEGLGLVFGHARVPNQDRAVIAAGRDEPLVVLGVRLQGLPR